MAFNSGDNIHSFFKLYKLRKQDNKLNEGGWYLNKERYRFCLLQKRTDLTAVFDTVLIDEDSSEFIRRFNGIKTGGRSSKCD